MSVITEATDLMDLTVGQLVVERPSRARVFEQFGIDYCCGGKKPLGQACRERQVDPQAILLALARSDTREAGGRDWAAMSMSDLADHIERTHHAYLKQELPRLDFLVRKVASRHGPDKPHLVELRDVFIGLYAEMLDHMQKEERVMFPLCRRLEQGGAGAVAGAFPCGVDKPVEVLTHEHEDAGRALAEIRRLTDDYTAPPEACNTYRALFDSLEQLEADMHQHVHLENNILFPRAVEAARAAG